MYSPGFFIAPGPKFEKGALRMQVTNVTNQFVGKIILNLLLKRLDGIHPAEESNLDGVFE
jgi:hypothetical protein